MEAASHLPRLFVSLHDAGLGAAAIGRVLALASDTATTRLVDLAIERVGQPPVPWAWLALGSVARREVTLASDQDNALAYDESDDPEVDAYFASFAEFVNGGLARCGFGEDNADVLARDPRWRMSRAAWQRTFEECLESPDRSHLVRAAVAFDFRHVIGGLEVTSPLVEISAGPRAPGLPRSARAHGHRSAPAARLRGRVLVQEADGKAGTVDLKLGGIVPIANLARFHALANGVRSPGRSTASGPGLFRGAGAATRSRAGRSAFYRRVAEFRLRPPCAADPGRAPARQPRRSEDAFARSSAATCVRPSAPSRTPRSSSRTTSHSGSSVARPALALVGLGRWGVHVLRDLVALGCDVTVVSRGGRARETALTASVPGSSTRSARCRTTFRAPSSARRRARTPR